jgi:DNA-binding NarL/FixJ family response regulator
VFKVPKTVLIADDNPMIRKMLGQMFETEEHYDLCAEASDGQEAIALAIQHKPDIIVLDFSMPIMSGLQAARKLKELMPHVPIILFTQHDETISKSIFANIDLVVSKANGAQLLDSIRSLVPAGQ